MQRIESRLIGEVLGDLNRSYPLETAESWDNVGLLIGDLSSSTTGAVVSIDLTFEALDLALQNNYHLIINHHPCIFPKDRGLSRLRSDSVIYSAVKNGIAVASYHTNFDRCSLEVVQAVSEGLGVVPQGRLHDKGSRGLMKLVVFVPSSHFEGVRKALVEVGAGHIGNYSECTFATRGEGTFKGCESTNPFLGKPGILEKVEELRLETIFPRGMQRQVVQALHNAHPYEEVAYDLYPVEQSPGSKGLVSGLGYGFWGDFPSPKPFSDLVKDVKSLFNIHGFWITNPAPTQVTRVGFVAGKGASFVEAATALNCDLLITGEVGYHTALDGSRRGVAMMELGHRESEKFFIETMKNRVSALGLGFVSAQMPTQKIWGLS